MRCLACGEEMVLIRAVADTTILVPGYEHQDWQCSICLDIEHRFVFTRRKRVPQPTAELLKANAPTTKQTDVAQASTESGELPRAEVLVHPTQPEPREANNPMRAQTDVEERGATRSTFASRRPRRTFQSNSRPQRRPKATLQRARKLTLKNTAQPRATRSRRPSRYSRRRTQHLLNLSKGQRRMSGGCLRAPGHGL